MPPRGFLAPGLMPLAPPARRFPLEAFSTWMHQLHASPATIATYTTRVRALLAATGAASDSLEDVAVVATSRELLEQYVATLAPSTQSQVQSAWRSFAAFLVSRGVENVALLADRRSARSYTCPAFAADSPRTSSGLPERVQQAIWHVLTKGHRPLTVDTLLSFTWRNTRFPNGSAPHNATTVDLEDHARSQWSYARPLTAWLILWEWAAGPVRTAPGYDQPILVAREGVDERIDPATVLSIVALGKRGAIPVLGPEPSERWRPWTAMTPTASGQLPGPPPPEPAGWTPPKPPPVEPPVEEPVDDDPLAAWESED